jgi:hypothetical protein
MLVYRTRLIGAACVLGLVVASAACLPASRLLLHHPAWLLPVLSGATLAAVIGGELAAKRKVVLLGESGEAEYVVRKVKQ